MSTSSLAKNGYVSSSKPTKHIKAKYFFIHHYHNPQELDLQYCPTEQMWANILTKPLQGPKFHMMRAFLMNFPVEYYEDPPFIPSPLPTLVPTPLSKNPYGSPIKWSLNPTSVLMKPQIPSIRPSSWGCVGTQPQDMARCIKKSTIPTTSRGHVPKALFKCSTGKK